MRILLPILLTGFSLLGGEPIVLVLNNALKLDAPSSEAIAKLLKGESLYLQGKKVHIYLTKPSSKSLPAVTYTLLKLSPGDYMKVIMEAKSNGVGLDPHFMNTAQEAEAAVADDPLGVSVLVASDAKGTSTRLITIK